VNLDLAGDEPPRARRGAEGDSGVCPEVAKELRSSVGDTIAGFRCKIKKKSTPVRSALFN